MSKSAAAKILAKRKKLKKPPSSSPSTNINFLKNAFPAQIAFLQDTSKFKIAHCPRGAAKSYTAGLGIYETLQAYPGCTVFYVTKTRDMARNIMWRNVLKEIDRDFQVGMDFNETLLEGRHPNGSTVRLTGIDGDAKQQDKLLGGKYHLVVLDEVAFFDTDLTSIIYRTLIPAAGRVGGSIWMVSTSSDLTRGLFYECTKPDTSTRAQGWTIHTWSWKDNPYVVAEMQATIDALIAANPLIVETNHFKQMYLNEWTVDESKLVYKWNKDRNVYKELPTHLSADGWTYILGIDFGWEDDNAFVLTGYHVNDPTLYIINTYKKPKLTYDEIISITKSFMSHPIYAPHKIYVDVAAKQGVESMRIRSGIPFQYADKTAKVEYIEQLNGDFIQGKVKLHASHTDLISELSTLTWKTSGDKIVFPKKEHPGMPNHLADALLYSWRSAFHYNSSPKEAILPMGSKAWYDKTTNMEQLWQDEFDRLSAEETSEPGWSTL